MVMHAEQSAGQHPVMTKQSLTPRGTGPTLEIFAGISSLHGNASQLRQGKTMEEMVKFYRDCECGDSHDIGFKCHSTVNDFVAPYEGDKANGSAYQVKIARASKVPKARLLSINNSLPSEPSNPSMNCRCRISENGLIDPIECTTEHVLFKIPKLDRWCDQTTTAMTDYCYLIYWSGWARPSVAKLLGRKPPALLVKELFARTARNMQHEGQRFFVKFDQESSVHVMQNMASRLKARQSIDFIIEQFGPGCRIGGLKRDKPKGVVATDWFKIRRLYKSISARVTRFDIASKCSLVKQKFTNVLKWFSNAAKQLKGYFEYMVILSEVNMCNLIDTNKFAKRVTTIVDSVQSQLAKITVSVSSNLMVGNAIINIPFVKMAVPSDKQIWLLLGTTLASWLMTVLIGVNVSTTVSVDPQVELANGDPSVKRMLRYFAEAIKKYIHMWLWALEPLTIAISNGYKAFRMLCTKGVRFSFSSKQSSGAQMGYTDQSPVSIESKTMEIAIVMKRWYMTILELLEQIDDNIRQMQLRLVKIATRGKRHNCGPGAKHSKLCKIVAASFYTPFARNRLSKLHRKHFPVQLIATCPSSIFIANYCSWVYVSWAVWETLPNADLPSNVAIKGPGEIGAAAVATDNTSSASLPDAQKHELVDAEIRKMHAKNKKVRKLSFDKLVPPQQVGQWPFECLENHGWMPYATAMLRTFWKDYAIKYNETKDSAKLEKILACRKLENYYALIDPPKSVDELKDLLDLEDFDRSDSAKYKKARQFKIELLPFSDKIANTPVTPKLASEVFKSAGFRQTGVPLAAGIEPDDNESDGSGSDITVVPAVTNKQVSQNPNALTLVMTMWLAFRSSNTSVLPHNVNLLLIAASPLGAVAVRGVTTVLQMAIEAWVSLGITIIEGLLPDVTLYNYYNRKEERKTAIPTLSLKIPVNDTLINPLSCNYVRMEHADFNLTATFGTKQIKGKSLCAGTFTSKHVAPGETIIVKHATIEARFTAMAFGRIGVSTVDVWCNCKDSVNGLCSIDLVVTASHILSNNAFYSRAPDFCLCFCSKSGRPTISHEIDILRELNMVGNSPGKGDSVYIQVEQGKLECIGTVFDAEMAVLEPENDNDFRVSRDVGFGDFSALAMRVRFIVGNPRGLSGTPILNSKGELIGVCSCTTPGLNLRDKLLSVAALPRITTIATILGRALISDINIEAMSKDSQIKPAGGGFYLEDVGVPLMKTTRQGYSTALCAALNATETMNGVYLCQANKSHYAESLVRIATDSSINNFLPDVNVLRMKKLVEVATHVPVEVTYLTRREARSSIRVADNMGDDEQWTKTGVDVLLAKVMQIRAKHKGNVDNFGAEGYLTMPGVFDTSARHSVANLRSKGRLDIDLYDRLPSSKVFNACAYILEMLMSTLDYATWHSTAAIIDASGMALSVEDMSIIVALARALPMRKKIILLSADQLKMERATLLQLKEMVRSTEISDSHHQLSHSSPGAAAYIVWTERVNSILMGSPVCPNYEEAPWLQVACTSLPKVGTREVLDAAKALIAVVYARSSSVTTAVPVGVTTNRSWRRTRTVLTEKVLSVLMSPIRLIRSGMHNVRQMIIENMAQMVADIISGVEAQLMQGRNWIIRQMFEKKQQQDEVDKEIRPTSRYFSWFDYASFGRASKPDSTNTPASASVLNTLFDWIPIPIWIALDFACDQVLLPLPHRRTLIHRAKEALLIVIGIEYLMSKVTSIFKSRRILDREYTESARKYALRLASILELVVFWKQDSQGMIRLVNLAKIKIMNFLVTAGVSEFLSKNVREIIANLNTPISMVLGSQLGLGISTIEIVVALVNLFTQRKLNVFHTTILILNSTVQAMKKNTKAELEKLRDKGFKYHLINPILPVSSHVAGNTIVAQLIQVCKESKVANQVLTSLLLALPVVSQTSIVAILGYRFFRILSEVAAERSILDFSAASNPAIADAMKSQQKFFERIESRSRMVVAVCAAIALSRSSIMNVSFPFEMLATIEMLVLFTSRNWKNGDTIKTAVVAMTAACTGQWSWAVPACIMALPKFDNDWANAFMRGPIMVALSQTELNVNNYRENRIMQMTEELLRREANNSDLTISKLAMAEAFNRKIGDVADSYARLSHCYTINDGLEQLQDALLASAYASSAVKIGTKSSNMNRQVKMTRIMKKRFRDQLLLVCNKNRKNTKFQNAVRKIINSEKFYADDEPVGHLRTVHLIGTIQSLEPSSSQELTRATIEDCEPPTYKLGEKLLTQDALCGAVLIPDTGIEVSLSLRQRTQCTPAARMKWLAIMSGNGSAIKVMDVILKIAIEFKERLIETKFLTLHEFALTYVGLNDSTTGVFTQSYTNIRGLKRIMAYMLDGGRDNLVDIMGDTYVGFLCFGKKEVMRPKAWKERSKAIAAYNGDREDDTRIRIIQAAEGPMRIDHKRSETAFNESLLLARHVLPIKIGLKYYQEWGATITNEYRYVLSLDITNFDGNQHLGFSTLPVIIRQLLSSTHESLEATTIHAMQTQIRTIVTKQGIAVDVLGTMASGDINTSADNSIRTMVAAVMNVDDSIMSKVKFKCQGDNISIESKDKASGQHLADSLTLCGLPTTVEGTCDRLEPRSALVQPEFLAVLGFRARIEVQLFNGKSVTLTKFVPWRNPDRIMPKLLSTTNSMGLRRMAHHMRLKIMLWLYTWPFDKNLLALAGSSRATLQTLSQHVYSISKYHDKEIARDNDKPDPGKPTPVISAVEGGWDAWAANSLGLTNLVQRILKVTYIDAMGKSAEMLGYKRVKGWSEPVPESIRRPYRPISAKGVILVHPSNITNKDGKLMRKHGCIFCEEVQITWPSITFDIAPVAVLNNNYDVQLRCVSDDEDRKFLGMTMSYPIMTCLEAKLLIE